MREIKYKILIVLLSIKWMPRVNLGDWIWYKKRKYLVVNGVRCGQWRLSDLNNDNGWVLRKDCKKVLSLKNYIGSFKSGYRFYMTNWYDIWARNGIESWMKSCHIW